jgi:sugar/nucleoside kinase (ribokinase family)
MTVDFTAELAAARVLAIIRGTDTAAAVATGRALLAEGVRLVEVALTTPGALRAIEAIRSDAPAGSLVGAGTVLTAGYLSGRLDGLGVAECLRRAVTLGAFAVSTRGDWEGLPRRDELSLLDGHETGNTIR